VDNEHWHCQCNTQGRSAGQGQSILPVTSAMIQAATPSAETFVLEDIEINQVCSVYAGAVLLYHVMSGDFCW